MMILEFYLSNKSEREEEVNINRFSAIFPTQSVCDLLYIQLEEEPTKTPNMVKWEKTPKLICYGRWGCQLGRDIGTHLT